MTPINSYDLIFINDLAFFITIIIIKLFATDTKFILREYDLASFISKFIQAVMLLVDNYHSIILK